MFVVAQHQISDPERFWSAVKEATPNLPAGVRIHHSLPNRDGTAAVCLWECHSLDSVREIIDGSVGAYSTNSYFEVSPDTAMGLPGRAAGTS